MALNQQMLQGNWNEFKGKLRERWGGLTDDELQYGQGNLEQLVGTIQRKTGETRESIENYLEELSDTASTSAEGMMDAARDYAGRAAESFQSGYVHTQHAIQHHPFESMMACFGAGIVTGVLLGFLVRSR